MPPPTPEEFIGYIVSNQQKFPAPLCINKSKLKGLYKPKIHALNAPALKQNVYTSGTSFSIEDLLPLFQIQERQNRHNRQNNDNGQETRNSTFDNPNVSYRPPFRRPSRLENPIHGMMPDIITNSACAVCGTNFSQHPPGFQCPCGHTQTARPYLAYSLNAPNAPNDATLNTPTQHDRHNNVHNSVYTVNSNGDIVGIYTTPTMVNTPMTNMINSLTAAGEPAGEPVSEPIRNITETSHTKNTLSTLSTLSTLPKNPTENHSKLLQKLRQYVVYTFLGNLILFPVYTILDFFN